MKWRILLSVSLPAYPLLFTTLGIGLYWHENVLPAVGPNLALWAVVIVFYLDSRIEKRGDPAFFLLISVTSILWLISSITGHELGKQIALAKELKGYSLKTVFQMSDLYFCYAFALASFCLALTVFVKYGKLAATREQPE